MTKQFGGTVTKKWLERYQKSANWKDGKFQNLEATVLEIGLAKIPRIIYRQLSGRSKRSPVQPLPVQAFDTSAFLEANSSAKFIWYGHSVILLRLNGLTILIDPMFGENASPIGPVATRRFSENTLALIDDLPEIDLLLLSHDHYDHLDFDSIQRLKRKTKKYFVALGVKRHLESWGIAPDLISEFDWWETVTFQQLAITFTPTRHFSGRGLTDRAKSLWGGWALKSPTENIWFSGDSGYGNHFAEIGKRLGPFDFGFLECGQYFESWQQIHMVPEECVQAAVDARVGIAMPVHWGAFTLAPHHWKDPILRFLAAAKEAKIQYATPALGELCGMTNHVATDWWEAHA